MEYCDGGSVQDILLKNGVGLTETCIAAITHQTVKGLSYLHSKNKIHRYIICFLI